MHDFGKIVYLDFQKTGSTFVSAFLRATCLFPEVKLQKHAWIDDDYRESTVYFTTVREPLMLYSSLYRYGLDRKGGVFQRIQQVNCLSAYDSFETFVAFLLNPENGRTLHPLYTGQVAGEVGFMSFRHLLLCLHRPAVKIQAAVAENRPLSELLKQSIARHVLRNESLRAELLKLSTETLPYCFDAAKARAFLAASNRVNESTLAPGALQLASSTLRQNINIKESILLRYY